jgi:hypothetical protein
MPLPGRSEAHRFPSRYARSTCVFVRRLQARLFFVALLAPAAAIAGPPFLTDDPQPTEPGHWEIYNFVQGTAGNGALLGEAGLDLNYGGAEDLQLTAVLPIGFDNENGFSASGLRTGTGMIELATKYKFLHQNGDGWLPDVSVFPRFLIPTQHNFGFSRTNFFLPIWAEKDFGPWSVFGGGGYELNPGPGARNFWQGGIAVNRTISDRLQLGVEVYGQTSDTAAGDGFTAVNFGATYKLVEHWSLLASAGPTWIQGGGHGGVFYLSLKADY